MKNDEQACIYKKNSRIPIKGTENFKELYKRNYYLKLLHSLNQKEKRKFEKLKKTKTHYLKILKNCPLKIL